MLDSTTPALATFRSHTLDTATYQQLRARARRLAPHAADAEDLVQNSLLAALEAGRNDLPWLYGVLRKQAAMQARGAARRRRRDLQADPAAATAAPDDIAATAASHPWHTTLAGLPPAARRVAVLAAHGLSADEIRWLLGLTPAAFRQRLSSIRRRLRTPPLATTHAEQVALAYLRDPARSVTLEFGLLRRALKVAMRAGPGLGTHDHDGHLLVVRDRRHANGAHTRGGHGNK